MSYVATVLQVMIASPGDVTEERRVIAEVIQEWNAVHSREKSIVLLPTAWETHAAPKMGGRPQAIINEQVLDKCDLLIGVFWTRLGTPTGVSVSGTVEEIEAHTKACKPAMLYFSNAPVPQQNMDTHQYNKLQDFKNKCMEKGLVGTYDNVDDFRNKLTSQLAITANTNEYIETYLSDTGSLTDALASDSEADAAQTPGVPELSDEAKTLLIEASKSSCGAVTKHRSLTHFNIAANDKEFVIDGDARSRAIWEGAINELCERDLLKPRGYEDTRFVVTREGYEVADILKQEMVSG